MLLRVRHTVVIHNLSATSTVYFLTSSIPDRVDDSKVHESVCRIGFHFSEAEVLVGPTSTVSR
jgi:hypothetical protein